MNGSKPSGGSSLGGVTFYHPGAFWFGTLAVTAGVIAHMPMYLMGKDTGLKYHRGQCIYEQGCYTFVGPTVAPGMKRKLEVGLLALTGRRFRAMVRRGEVEEARHGSGVDLPV